MKCNIFLAILFLVTITFAVCSAVSIGANNGQIWQLVWFDEFNGKIVDTDKWGFDIDCWGGGNQEQQCYTNREMNVRVKDGKLEIIARREKYTGQALPQRLWKTPIDARKYLTRSYTSARLFTKGKGDWRYGRIEVRAKLPAGQGIWPAIWMLPSDDYYGMWAASGEIDIMEAVNLGTVCSTCEGGYENHILGTLHYGGKWPDNVYTSKKTSLKTPWNAYHIYAIEWSAGEIKWFVDDEIYATQNDQGWYSSGMKTQGHPFAPFDQRFHLILNVAVGGGLAEGRNIGGISEKGFPKTMYIDWVRVYKCKADPDNGLACRRG